MPGKLQQLKLYLPRKKWALNEMLILFKIVFLVFNIFISANFQLNSDFLSSFLEFYWNKILQKLSKCLYHIFLVWFAVFV